ncbi:winged helix DNA-binding domain-containing protein [Actinomadura rubrisoli]|uniref:Winged helix DNA-binding domain-containing protein n=1 Tax=Actinomadura rubrisoli TaxID=2530368 RepID=A0A4R5BWQ2_9ACTN|nr:winged helix DNA-binding domain-containing protein [Actinomadura rubrisoli]TDD88732.1 winged helix DNA-binding domain-containing protein [Actinomadura rubrisoli]
MTWTQVCARRLERHALSVPSKAALADVVAGTAGVHAQVMSAAELGIGLRAEGATRADVRKALWDDGTLIKTYGPRGTVHVLPARDLPMWVGALSALPTPPSPFPDPARMTAEQTDEVVAAIGASLEEEDLTVDELGDAVVGRTGPWAGDLVMPAFQTLWPRWRQAMGAAGTRGALCFGPARGRKVTYSSPRRRIPGFRPAEGSGALGDLVRCYLHAYGPATPARFAHWLNAPVPWAAELFASLDLEPVEVKGVPNWVARGDTSLPADPPRGVRLLPYFDGYAYRVGNQPPELLYPGRAHERVLRANFQSLLVDGVVAGLWHQRRSGRRIDVTVEPLVTLSRAQRAELDGQVERVAHVLEGRPELTIGPVTVGGHA